MRDGSQKRHELQSLSLRLGGTVSTARQHLPVAHVTRMIGAYGAALTDSIAKGALFGQLDAIGKMVRQAPGRGDRPTRTHRALCPVIPESDLRPPAPARSTACRIE